VQTLLYGGNFQSNTVITCNYSRSYRSNRVPNYHVPLYLDPLITLSHPLVVLMTADGATVFEIPSVYRHHSYKFHS
jgi:hypothetical protein